MQSSSELKTLKFKSFDLLKKGFYIAAIKPELNKQVKPYELKVFPEGIGITWYAKTATLS